MHYRLLVFLLLFCPCLIHAQPGRDTGDPYAREWRKADSLMDHGLPQSAATVIRDVYAKAKASGRSVSMVRAQLYLIRAESAYEEGVDTARIRLAEREAQSAPFPVSNIWHSLAAEFYGQYYRQHRWQLLQRTRLTTPGASIAEWDAAQLMGVIAAHVNASLQRPDELYAVRLEAYEPLIVKGVNTRHLRPTLYDLLAFRALQFLGNDESSLPQPAAPFRIDDPALLSPAASFVHLDVRKAAGTVDTASLQLRALQLYQDILRRHLADKDPAALIDADLHRLAFVYEHAVFPDKKTVYRHALESLIARYPDAAAAAEARYRLAALLYEEEQPVTDEDNRQRPQVHTRDLKAIKAALETVISRFPNSEGSAHAQALLQDITAQQLSLKAEEVVLPGEPSKVLLGYKNIAHVWVRLTKLSTDQYLQLLRGDGNPDQIMLAGQAVKTWETDLPGTGDYEYHFTELPVDAVANGTYALLVSEDKAFSRTGNNLAFVQFQASSLSLITVNNSRSGYVLHRKTGMPLGGATVDLYEQQYTGKGYERRKKATGTSGKDGAFRVSANGSFNNATIRYGDDVLYTNNYIGLYEEGAGTQPPAERTFFFTDRSIYRPGQTVWFKGIRVKTEGGGRKATVLPGVPVTVTLYDVNNQKVHTLQLRSNEYGSFSGSFTAPAGGLTGQMRISDDHGDVYLSVEEYKRPKFFVSFDTLKAAYVLNESVTVRGQAKAYAGSAIDGATVKYRVVRETRWPYDWLYRWGGGRRSPQQEITRGTVQTDAQGAFTVTFSTLPDPTVDPKSLPVFTYAVYADVTDAAGETRSGQERIQAGYRGLQIRTVIPEKARPADLDSIRVLTTNLNGQFVPATVQVRISPLQAPAVLPRARLWQQPDQFVIGEADFKRLFPLDEYRDESDYRSWPQGPAVWEKSITSTESGLLTVPPAVFSRNGWYLVSTRTSDNKGQPVEDKQYVQVWDPALSGNLPTALSIFKPAAPQEPGQTPRVHAVSSYATPALLLTELTADGKTSTDWQYPQNGVHTWSRTLTEADCGGVALQWLMVKENRVYLAAETVEVPWSNKDLDLSWETHRDKLQPGASETWTLVVRGAKKEKVAAELVATLYDASLDAFRKQEWGIYGLYPGVSMTRSYNTGNGFGAVDGGQRGKEGKGWEDYPKAYDELLSLDDGFGYGRGPVRFSPPEVRAQGRNSRGRLYVVDGVQYPAGSAKMPVAANAAKSTAAVGDAAAVEASEELEQLPGGVPPAGGAVPLRKNLQETAFFLPQLHTDADGNIRIPFTLPEALTEWRFLALAHTKEMAFGQTGGTIKTQKDLMVQPNLPRFFRQGDDLVIATKISNLSPNDLSGTATLELVDAQTLRPLALPYRLVQPKASFSAPKGQSTTASWRIHVPEAMYEPVIVRISATAGSFTDGEETVLPVLTNRMLVTETLPLWTTGEGARTFRFDKLLHSDTGRTLAQHGLTLEYTTNPAWYAVLALPYLMEYPYECAEQVFNRYYANALAGHIIDGAPRVKEIFRKWQTKDTAALLSNLRKNEELKSALLEETPWVLEAQSETEQRHNIAKLFDSYRLSGEGAANLRKLQDMMLPEGAFPWFKGMGPDRYITQYIATGLARLEHLGIANDASRQLGTQLRGYLSRQLAADYDRLVKSKAKLTDQHIGYLEVQYLYLRSFHPQWKGDAAAEKAFTYYKGQAAAYWPKFNPYAKGMTALALQRLGDGATPRQVIQSLRETSQYKEELGRYWLQPGSSYWWYEAPVEAQSLLIECFKEVARDTATVDDLKRWLLKQKQTQHWRTTKATADACYALLLTGSSWLDASPQVTITLGDQTVRSEEQQAEAGTGYFKVHYTGPEVKPAMGNITVRTETRATSSGGREGTWGAVYWQYFEDMDKITAAATPLALRKGLYIERNGPRGPVLEEVSAANQPKVGDRVKIRIVLQADRDMEYVHLKDQRASCFEPVNVVSGYRWQDGLGYYESTRDASSNFFISYLRKGTYVFEYPVNVMAKGDFSNGIATVQCMYAPEFSSHSEGIRVKVE